MANIDALLASLKNPSTNGQESRDIIIKLLNKINTEGTNAQTLNGYSADYFVSKEEFDIKVNRYFRRIGLVHDFAKVIDEQDPPNKTILTMKYTNDIIKTPFDVTDKNTTVLDASSVANTGSAQPIYDVTLPTSNAVWQILGYSDLDELERFINDQAGGGY